MVSLYPSDFYANMFHPIIAAGNYKSHLMIYSIDLAENPIDVDSRAQVEYYAELLTYENTDTDSNRRISQNGIKLNNYYNKDEEYTIGNAPIASIDISFINDDGFFSTYDWEQTIIVYWDVWDEANQMWIGCPIGVYWWERPAKTSAVIVNATAYDGMYRLDQYTSWSWPTFENGSYTLGTVYTSLVANIAGVLPYATPEDWPNMTITIDSAPFDVTNMTNREILAKLAEIAGSNVFASRDGRIKMKPFTDAYWKPAPQAQPIYYELDGDSLPTPITKIEIGEYTVPSITQFIAQVGQTGKEFIVGSGTQTMYSINNGFLAVDDTKANQMITTMLGVVSGTDASSDMVPYAPLYIRAYADPAVEAGDVIRVIRNETTYLMPVFQQTLYWNGADWIVEMQNSGYANRTIPSEADRMSYVFEQRMSGLEPYQGGYDASDSTPYVMRPSFAGNRENDKLIGGTVAWNQLLDGSADANWAANNATKSFSDGICTFTASAKDGYVQLNVARTEKDHVYLAIVDIKETTATNLVALNFYGSDYKYCEATTNWQRVASINKRSASNNNFKMRVSDRRTSGWDAVQVKNFMLFDLTAMFGSSIADYAYTLESGTAGAGIAWLKKYGWFAKDYYPYHAATLESVNTSAHVMRDSSDGIIGNYALDPDLQLRGILKKDASNNLYYDGDTYNADGTVTRKYGIVDLGTLTWIKQTTNYMNFASNGIKDLVKKPDTTDSGYKIVRCSKYASDIISSTRDNYIYITADGQIRIKDTSSESLTAAQFKTAMSGVYLVYELATPTTESADPYTNPQVVDANGTEQYVDAAYTAGTRDIEMPVGHNTDYYNLQSDAQEIYNTPTTDGSYRLVCNVVNGKASFVWVEI